MFSLFRKSQPFLSEKEQAIILNAIQDAEKQTSGEIRLFIEGRCKYIDPLDRAVEIFHSLKMTETQFRNGVLVYIAKKDKQLAIYGDEGIHQKVGAAFWNEEVKKMIAEFKANHFAEGLAQIISDIGAALQHHFPYDQKGDTNELPNDIVFGK